MEHLGTYSTIFQSISQHVFTYRIESGSKFYKRKIVNQLIVYQINK